MDGKQGKMKQSLQFRLSVWLALVIFGVALAAGVFSFYAAFHEANELQDDQLDQMADLVNRHQIGAMPLAPRKKVSDTDSELRVIVQSLPAPGALTHDASAAALVLPSDLPEGIQTVTVNTEAWRVFVKTLDSGARIAASQRTAVRDEIARESALRTLTPFLILIPILLLLVGDLIRKMFRPLKLLALDLDQRSEQDLRHLSETRLPSEISPFVVAINRLLSRVAQSLALQRRFVADAAHELRSPLTALSLQAEQLEAADMSTLARERLGTLKNGLKRTQMLLNQLLAFARAQQPAATQFPSVSIQHVFRKVLEDLMPLAEAKQIDLGVVGESDASIAIQEADLTMLVKNLVENAIRYTPAGGQVDLSVQSSPGQVSLVVDDTGPGISENERERVFDPFYRVLGNEEAGSGLGLSIVKTIADRVGAKVTLGAVRSEVNAPGLRVRVTFMYSALSNPLNSASSRMPIPYHGSRAACAAKDKPPVRI